MLIRRQVIVEPPEPSVIIVRPRKPIGGYVALALGTVAAVGMICYAAYALPQRDDSAPTIVRVPARNSGRAERFSAPTPKATPPIIVVNPTPVYVNPQPAHPPQPPLPVYVEGAPQGSEPPSAEPEPENPNQVPPDRD